jgi:hypothetical protein
VSDSKNGNGAKPKRDWLAIRHEYETGSISMRALAERPGAPSEASIFRRSQREGWVQAAKLARKTARDIDAKLQSAVEARVRDELAPWIEKEKERFTKRGFKLALTGVKRAERYFKRVPDADAKSEANIAKAADTYHRMGRLALGMSDGAGVGGTYSVNVLANHAMIQAAPSQSQD